MCQLSEIKRASLSSKTIFPSEDIICNMETFKIRSIPAPAHNSPDGFHVPNSVR
ncbi:hypothetical protein MUA90_02385 [Staphylococcus sp. IVB6181]|nr:hypothetical protein MUA90_02385 [Staphylococcus sp. IVB6181]